MDNEFMRIALRCDGDYVVPRNPPGLSKYPEVLGPNQACTLYGATPGLDTVDGAAYISSGYTLNVHDLWKRNFLVLIGWFLFYQIAQVLLIEYLNVSSLRIPSVSSKLTFRSGFIRASGCRDLQEGERGDQSLEQGTEGTTGHPGEDRRRQCPEGEEVVPGSEGIYLGEGQLRGSCTCRHQTSPARHLRIHQARHFDGFDGRERGRQDHRARCPRSEEKHRCDQWRPAR